MIDWVDLSRFGVAALIVLLMAACLDVGGGLVSDADVDSEPIEVLRSASELSPEVYDAYSEVVSMGYAGVEFVQLAKVAAPAGHFYAALGLKQLGMELEYNDAIRLFEVRAQVLNFSYVRFLGDGKEIGDPIPADNAIDTSEELDRCVSFCARSRLTTERGIPVVLHINYLGE